MTENITYPHTRVVISLKTTSALWNFYCSPISVFVLSISGYERIYHQNIMSDYNKYYNVIKRR